ncbi:MAG: DUF3427 domain-containing protein [Desulfosporosinus sp.]|nr:DUF3427 domain-containing protein [Desulfosporosinus sp.]
MTLNKSEKYYSTSTMYQDYSINEELFHWQSQSRTTEESLTGQRYLNQVASDGNVLFFVREYKKEGAFAATFTCIGFADFECHYGSAPISIVWKMKEPLSGFVMKKTVKILG